DIATLPPVAQFAFWACFLASVAAAQTFRYHRVASTLQRQQAKWVLLDLVVGGIGLVVLAGIALAVLVSVPRSGATATFLAALFGVPVLYLAFLCIPVSIVIAMLRYRLFDVDILLNRTLVYGILTTALALVYTVCVIAFQALLGLLGGLAQTSQGAIV